MSRLNQVGCHARTLCGRHRLDRGDGAMLGPKPLLNGSSTNATSLWASAPLRLTIAFGGLHGACGP